MADRTDAWALVRLFARNMRSSEEKQGSTLTFRAVEQKTAKEEALETLIHDSFSLHGGETQIDEPSCTGL